MGFATSETHDFVVCWMLSIVSPFQEKRQLAMTESTTMNTVADSSLPLLATLIQARKQAHWQWRNCADEHKHRWTCVIARLDERISQGEKYIAGLMRLTVFHAKRVIGE